MVYSVTVGDTNYFFDGNTLQLYEKEYVEEHLEESDMQERKNKNIVRMATFFVTDVCNGNCVYCYEEHGTSYMNKKAADKAIGYLIGKAKRIEKVSFFGGEPLLNFEIIKYVAKKLKDNFLIDQFEITTNSVLMNDEMLDFFVKNNFKIIISIDGPADIHDKMRINCPHYKVLENIKKIKATKIGKILELNCTYTRYHKENIETSELEKYFEQMGVKYNISGVITDVEWLKIKDADSNQTKESIDKAYEHLVSGDLNVGINSYVGGIINAIVHHKYSCNFCEELCAGVAFDTDGECYQCTRLIRKCKMNNPKLKELNRKNSDICRKCWASGLCVHCTASMFLQGEMPYEEDRCIKKEMYAYSLTKLLGYLHDDPQKFQMIIDNYFA